jgi:hypothetical protein
MPEEILTDEMSPEQLAYYEDRIQFAKDLNSLLSTNKTLQRFIKEYTEDYAITQLNNAHSFDGNSAVRFVEKFKARSHFLNFMHETIEDGRKMAFELQDGREEQL